MKSVSVSQRLSAYLKVNTSVQKHSIDFMLKDLSHLNFLCHSRDEINAMNCSDNCIDNSVWSNSMDIRHVIL